MFKQFASQIKKNPDVQKWLNAHPKITQQLRDRFNRKTFFGLPLTLIVASSFISLAVLLGIIQDYLARDPLIAADAQITNLLFAFRSSFGVRAFYITTLFASPLTAIAIIGFFILLFLFRAQWKKAAIVFVGLVSVEGLTTVLKILFHRTRPDLFLQAVNEDSYSLPSGHATTAAFVFGYIGYQAFLRFKTKIARAFIILSIIIAILLIDLSRMYLGVHYLSDVIAGNMIGLLGLFLVIGVDQWYMERRK